MDQVSISVPASSANVGLGYDTWSLGLVQPRLIVTCTRQSSDIRIGQVRSTMNAPQGRQFGHTAIEATTIFLNDLDIREGVRLSFEDDGYPVGGLGRSGAEAVGAVLGTAILYGQHPSRDQVITAAAKGEPGGHRDNVAGSVNGRFNITTDDPLTGTSLISAFDPPEDLGITIGYSSHKKTGGTLAMREALRKPLPVQEFVSQISLISAATAFLISGNTRGFLRLVWADNFHEPRRANAGGYGSFNAGDLRAFKRNLFEQENIAVNISGAGPNIQFLYCKTDHPSGISERICSKTISWFLERNITMSLEPTEIAKEGAYDVARREYDL